MSDTNKKIYRQGDVLLIPTDKIPDGLKETKRITLALGEVTGHHHSIVDFGATGYADSEDGLATYLAVENPEGVELTHQEHDTITIPYGDYQVFIQREYTPEAIKQVRD